MSYFIYGRRYGNGLLNGLVEYWPLNEAAGANDALGLHAAATLTQNSSPGSDTGKVYAGARTFDGSADYFSRASEAQLQAAGAFAISAWIYPSAVNSYAGILSKWQELGAPTLEFCLRGCNDGRINFLIGNGTSNTEVFSAAISANAWTFVAAWHDDTANKLYLQINDSTPVSANLTHSVQAATSPLLIGRTTTNNNTQHFNGRLGPIAFWRNRTLDESARRFLWNGGAGLPYASFTT